MFSYGDNLMAKIDSYDGITAPSAPYSFISLTSTGAGWAGETFIASQTYYITSVWFYLLRVNTGGILTVVVTTVDSATDKPTTTVLGSSTLDVSGISTGYSWVEVPFATPVKITKGTKYGVIAKHNIANVIKLGYTASDAVYTNGHGVSTVNSGSTWTVISDVYFRVYGSYSPPSDQRYTKKLVAIAGNSLWYESVAGTMSELAVSSGDIDTSGIVSIFEAYQKVMVCDISGFKVADFGNKKITTADLGLNPPHPGTVLTGDTSGAIMVVDYITNLDGNEACIIYGKKVNLNEFSSGETVTGTNDDETSVSFSTNAAEVGGPFWYDWTVFGGADGTHSDYGTMPSTAPLGCLYRGRAVIGGSPANPNQWYMSRQGCMFDFVFTAGDAQSAVAGNNADAGELGDILTALIPFKDDFLVFGCANTLWYLAGDPMAGGQLNELDLTTGMFGPQSWCFGDGGTLYFWGANGIYRTTIPGTPECISQMSLPSLVEDKNVSVSTHRITMIYDRIRVGILVCITRVEDGSNSNYWYSLKTGGFFPEVYPDECGAFSLSNYDSTDTTYRKLLIGCNDGYIRTFDEATKSDNVGATDEAIDSYVTFGPINLGKDKGEANIGSIDIVVAGGFTGGSKSDSNDIDYSVFTSLNAENLKEQLDAGSDPRISGVASISGPRGGTNRRTARGVYACIKLGNNTVAETWGMESLSFVINKHGKVK